MLLQHVLGGVPAVLLVDPGPVLGEILHCRVPGENPGVLVQCLSKQHGQASD